MARNVEVKARVRDMEALARRAAALADTGPTRIPQHDTFFRVTTGRLKLRRLDGGAELIHYRRSDAAGPELSSYGRVPVSEPAALRTLLADALGVAGEVRKERMLYRMGRTRIHLDRVEGLGDFMEIEVVLAPDEPVEMGAAEAGRVMDVLGIETGDLVDGSYIDLQRA